MTEPLGEPQNIKIYNNASYYTDLKAEYPLTEVLPGRNQKHGGRVFAVIEKLKHTGALREKHPDLFEVVSGERLQWLDVGAGSAPIARLVADYYASCFSVTSIDLVQMGVRVLNLNGLRPPYIQGDTGKLPFNDNSFDILSAHDVLEHLQDPSPGLREAFRVVRPGGLFHIVVPNPDSWITGTDNDTYAHDPTHVYPAVVGTEYFREQLGLLGFDQVEVTTRGFPETTKVFRETGSELFKPEGGNHIYAFAFKPY